MCQWWHACPVADPDVQYLFRFLPTERATKDITQYSTFVCLILIMGKQVINQVAADRVEVSTKKTNLALPFHGVNSGDMDPQHTPLLNYN